MVAVGWPGDEFTIPWTTLIYRQGGLRGQRWGHVGWNTGLQVSTTLPRAGDVGGERGPEQVLPGGRCLAKLSSECLLAVDTALGAVTSSGSLESEPIVFLVFSDLWAEIFL